MTRMKKMIAMLLVLSLFVSGQGIVRADSGRTVLPMALDVIENSAFYGDSSLDVVEIPYGTSRIEKLAFANSGIRLIILPDTVEYIAPDAFSGTNVKFRASEGSYAQTWAASNGFAWETGMNEQEAKQTLEELATDGLKEDDLYSEISDLVSTEGIESAEILADLAELNTLIETGNTLAVQSNELAVSLQQNAAELADCAASMTQETTGSHVKLTIDSVSMTVDRSIADSADADILDLSVSEDGSLTVMTVSNGETWYMYGQGGNYYVSKQQPDLSNAAGLVQKGAAGDFITRANQLLEQILNLYGFVDGTLENQLNSTNLEISNLRERRSLSIVKQNDYTKARDAMVHNSPSYNEFNDVVKKYRKEMVDANLRLPKLIKRANLLDRTIKAFKALNLVNIGASVGRMIAFWLELNEIDEHGHPDSRDSTAAAIRLANRMNCTIREMRTYLVTNFLMMMAQLLTDVVVLASAVPSAGTSVVPGIIINAIFIVLGGLMGSRLDSTMAKVRDDHQWLHTYVYGWVTDWITGLPLQGVRVSDGVNELFTDGNGYFEMYVYVNSVTLTFTKEGYEDDSCTVMPVKNEATRVPDRTMSSEPGIVYGYIYDEITRERLPGVTVSWGNISVETDAGGRYQITLPSGQEVNLKLTKAGYAQGKITVTPLLNNPQQRDGMITADTGVIYGRITNENGSEPLPDVSVSVNGMIVTYTDENGNYEITVPACMNAIEYERNGFGRISLTFAVASGQRIRKNLKLRPSGIPLDEEHFPDEGFRGYLSAWDWNRSGTLDYDETENITELSVQGAFDGYPATTTLKGIEYLWHIDTLTIRNLAITSLDVSDCYSLKTLICTNSMLTGLDVSKCDALQWVGISECSQLTSLKVNGCETLTKIECTRCNLGSIDVTGCPALNWLNLKRNPGLQSVNAGGNTSIAHIEVGNTWDSDDGACSAINAGGCTNLDYLYAYACGITSVSVSGCANLTYVNVYDFNQSLQGSLNLGAAKDLNFLNYSSRGMLTIYVNSQSPYWQKKLDENYDIDPSLVPV